MSKNKAKKQSNGRMKESAKLAFSSIISNAACVELGRTRPWYSAIIVALLSVILCVIPIGVQRAWVNGSDFLGSTTNGYEYGLVQFEEDVNALNSDADTTNDLDIRINAGTRRLEVSKGENCPLFNATTPYYQHVDPNDGTVTFEVYITALEGSNYTTFISNLTTNKIDNYSGAERTYTCNLLILQTSEIRGYIYLGSSASSASNNFTGKYDVSQSFSLTDLLEKDSHGNEYAVGLSEVSDATTYGKFLSNNLSATKVFLDESYYSTKVSTAWSWTGIWSAVFAGFILFMGLMIFLMTRGKNNPYRIFSFWETQKIAYWAAFTPAILSMVLSFFLSNFAMFFFIFLYGMRMMWLSMKTLRPESK